MINIIAVLSSLVLSMGLVVYGLFYMKYNRLHTTLVIVTSVVVFGILKYNCDNIKEDNSYVTTTIERRG